MNVIIRSYTVVSGRGEVGVGIGEGGMPPQDFNLHPFRWRNGVNQKIRKLCAW